MGADYLDEVVNRPKMGFTFPMGRWIQNAWSDIKACGAATSSLISDSQLEAVARAYGKAQMSEQASLSSNAFEAAGFEHYVASCR